MPKLYLIETDSPNAFATGRNPEHAAVAVTRGLMGLLNSREIEGVLAHDLSHVKNRDILISSIAATLSGAIMYMADMFRFAMFFGGFGGRAQEDSRGGILPLLAMAILAPIAALLIQMSVSRSRE
jgi:heat shock protein HtpX